MARSFRIAGLPVCLLMGLVFASGCSVRRPSYRSPYAGGRVLHNITPGSDYNPPSDPIPMTPPAPRDSDPAPPMRSTSDLPPAPPKDDFESAENPGRHSASFGPYTGHVTPASKSTDQLDSSL